MAGATGRVQDGREATGGGEILVRGGGVHREDHQCQGEQQAYETCATRETSSVLDPFCLVLSLQYIKYPGIVDDSCAQTQ